MATVCGIVRVNHESTVGSLSAPRSAPDLLGGLESSVLGEPAKLDSAPAHQCSTLHLFSLDFKIGGPSASLCHNRILGPLT